MLEGAEDEVEAANAVGADALADLADHYQPLGALRLLAAGTPWLPAAAPT